MKLTIEQTLTKNDFTNIIITALEGGIGYWGCLNNDKPEFDKLKNMSVSEKVAEILWSGGSIELFDTDYDYQEADKWELTIGKFVNGLIKYMKTDSKSFELENLDSLECDKIIQYALFNELVFG